MISNTDRYIILDYVGQNASREHDDTYIAANTDKIILGTSVIDMLFHNPVILAKRFATLDVLSEGRVVAGLGIGWSRDEYQVSNVPFNDRGKRADEFIQVLKKIWVDDVVEFKGEYYNIPASVWITGE